MSGYANDTESNNCIRYIEKVISTADRRKRVLNYPNQL